MYILHRFSVSHPAHSFVLCYQDMHNARVVEFLEGRNTANEKVGHLVDAAVYLM